MSGCAKNSSFASGHHVHARSDYAGEVHWPSALVGVADRYRLTGGNAKQKKAQAKLSSSLFASSSGAKSRCCRRQRLTNRRRSTFHRFLSDDPLLGLMAKVASLGLQVVLPKAHTDSFFKSLTLIRRFYKMHWHWQCTEGGNNGAHRLGPVDPAVLASEWSSLADPTVCRSLVIQSALRYKR